MTEEMTYLCKNCGEDKPGSQFYKNKATSKVIFPCKQCKAAYYKAWKEAHKDYHKTWKQQNPEKVKKHHEKYQAKQKNNSSP